MSEIITIDAEERTVSGKGDARALRRSGKIPAIIYGEGKTPVSIILPEKEITKYYRKPQFITQIFEFKTAKNTYKVLPKDVQLHPITESVTHADFVFVADKVQKMQVPIVYANKDISLGVKRGGYFNVIRRKVLISCPVENMVRKIEIDVSKMAVSTSLTIKDLKLPEGAKLLEKSDLVIASIIGKRGKSSQEESSEDEAA